MSKDNNEIGFFEELTQQLLLAREHEIAKRFEANTVVINDEFDYCKGFDYETLSTIVKVNPMILGKHVFVGKLPSKYSFAIGQCQSEEPSELEYYKKRCRMLEEKLERIKEELGHEGD